MSERSQLTRLRFGAVSAEVGLIKASTKPRGAQHETRRVLVEAPDPRTPHAQAFDAIDTLGERREATTDPFGDPSPVPAETGIDPAADPAWPAHTTEPKRQRVEHDVDPTHPDTPPDPVRLDEDHAERRQAAAVRDMLDSVPESAPTSAPGAPEAAPPTALEYGRAQSPEPLEDDAPPPTYVPPATRVEQGVHLENGTGVDLTERLEEVDRLTKVDGLEVVRTIPASSYSSEHVRELHYIAGVNPGEYKVLALLWRALRDERMAAEVRWTKRTAQTRGIILARGELGSKSDPAYLALLELEWAANIRKPSRRATGPIGAAVEPREIEAAAELVEAFRARAPREELRDERLAKRAELLGLARDGLLDEYVPPAEPMPDEFRDEPNIAEALRLASAWVRDYAPA
jgi:hypothetical protein